MDVIRVLKSILSDISADAYTDNGIDIKGVLANLSAFLTNNDVQANELFQRYGSDIIDAFGETAVQIGELISNFDYAEALFLIRELSIDQ